MQILVAHEVALRFFVFGDVGGDIGGAIEKGDFVSPFFIDAFY